MTEDEAVAAAQKFAGLVAECAEAAEKRTGLPIEQCFLAILTGVVGELVVMSGADLDALFSKVPR